MMDGFLDMDDLAMSQTILPLACIYIYQYIYPISLGNFNILQPCCRKCLRDNRENLGKTR